MAKVVPIGQPVNDVERDAIAFLRDHLPNNYTIFHNVEIAEPGRAPQEYDMIVIGEHAIYAVEVKGYRGRVTGNKRDWYVAGRHRRSPLPTTFQKARVLSGRLRHSQKGVGPVWVEALVFLANPLVDPAFEPECSAHIHTYDTIVSALTERDALHLPHWPIKPPARYSAAIKQFLLGGRPSPGRTRVGSYRLLQEIGGTRYFRDYEAVNEALLATGADDEQVLRLRLYQIDPYVHEDEAERQLHLGRWEASVLKMLGEHDGLLVAGDPFFPQDDDIGVALPFEYAEGVTLGSYLETHGPLSPQKCIDRFSAAVQALGLAHSRAVVHRRITPDAFLCADSGPFRLGDFAFSAMAEQQEWEDGPPAHVSLDYSAPEVIRGAPATPAADVFSLGVVLLEALIGKRPFSTVEDATLPPSEVESCGFLAPILRDMLQPDPKLRLQDGYEVIERFVEQPPDGEKQPVVLVTGDQLLPDGTVLNDTYEIERRVGPPRTRTTYVARHRVSNHRRMLRFFEADAGTLAEAQVAFDRCYSLHHRCLARFNQLDRVREPEMTGPRGDPVYFLDVELVSGRTAEAIIEAGGVAPRAAIAICAQIGGLLAYLSGFDLHHGGIEASNVHIGDDGQVTVARPPSLLPEGVLSPPLFNHFDPSDEVGLEQDFRTLAMLCWELVTGIHPFALHKDVERDLGKFDPNTDEGMLARAIGKTVQGIMKHRFEASKLIERLQAL